MKVARQKKVVIVTNIPNPYRVPLFNEVNRQLAANGIELKIIFGASGYARRKFKLDMNDCKFDYEILNSKKIHFGDDEKMYFSYKGLSNVLRNERPDAIIVSGFSIVTMRLWLRSFFQRTKYIIWSGSIEKAGHQNSWIKLLLRKRLLKRAIAFISYGSKSAEYFQKLGAERSSVFTAINTVDTEFFLNRTKSLKGSLKNSEGKKHLTYVGYLSQRKNVSKVLEVIKKLAETRQDFILDLVGEGDDRLALESYVNENDLSGIVKFHGFVQKEQLPEIFATSDCFLFQTDFDIWGLVLNEAMAAGLPCISSVNAGATDDLIMEGETGFKMDYNNTEAVAEKINWILDHEKEARQIGENASRFISEKVGIGASAEGFIKAIESVFS